MLSALAVLLELPAQLAGLVLQVYLSADQFLLEELSADFLADFVRLDPN